MTVDAYMVEDAGGETHIVPAEDVRVDDMRMTIAQANGETLDGGKLVGWWDTGWSDEPADMVTVLASLELWRSVDHGLRTVDETALEVIGEVCEAIVAPVLMWMSDNGLGVSNYEPYGRVWGLKGRYIRPTVNYLAALCLERGLPADAWDGSGWFDALQDEDGWQEPIYGQGCEQDECEDAWSACGGVVDHSSDAGMTWLYRVMEDHTR